MKAAVIGLGEILSGDMGAGCCVLEMLAQETPEDALALHYLSRDAQHAGAYIFGMPYAVIVQALPWGGPPGRIYRWDLDAFRRGATLFAGGCDSLARLAGSLGRVELTGRMPSDILFVWIEPERKVGVGLSGTARRAARRSVQIIKNWLCAKQVISKDALSLRAFYRFDFYAPCPDRMERRLRRPSGWKSNPRPFR